jgi:CD2 antigen cytoplasmic tail-binding protein 2
MPGSKRSFDIQGESSSKRVRFDKKPKARSSGETDFEFSHEDELEGKKSRRGAVNFDVYDSEDEEVGGGIYSSDSDDENKSEEKEKEIPAASEDFDMFEGDPEPVKPKQKVDPNTQIEGQEFNSYDREDSDDDDVENGQKKEGKISAFNMNQEMEEGSLDDKGNYIRNKVDPQAFHDKWMEGISRKDINKAKEALEKREREEALKEAERQSNIPQTQTDIYLALVGYLKPGQTVQEALTSLANSLPKKVPAWKQKMLDKKNKNKKGKDTAAVPTLTEDEENARRQKVETITGLADQMMALGHFNVYEDTFEIMVRHLRREGAVAQDWLPESVNHY